MKIFGYEVSKAKAQKPKTSPVGMIGLKTSSGLVDEEFIRDLRWPDAGKIYQEMSSNDAVVGGCLYLIETLLQKATWTVKAATEDSADVEHAKFLESCMHDMEDQTWTEFISEVLSMLTYGFSFHEIIYKVRRGPDERDPKFRSRYSDGKIGWREMPIRSQTTWSEWTFDEQTGKPLEFVQDPGLAGAQGDIVKIPIEGNLLFKTKSSRNNPEGQSILRRAYRSWYFKRFIEELEGVGIERNLAGIPVLQPPSDIAIFDPNNPEMVELLSWSQDLVDSLRQDRNHGVVIPGEWTLKLLGAEGANKAIDTDKVIHRHEARIAMTMLADVVIMGGDRTGSFALAEVKQSLFMSSLQSILNNICDTLNTKAVPKLFSFNGIILEEYPKIVVDDLETPSIKEIALLLRSMKVDVTTNKTLYNFLLDLINAPELTQEEFDALAGDPSTDDTDTNPDGPSESDDHYQDDAENDFKQSDLDYM